MRKAKPKKRQILPDPVFGDVKVSKFVNHLMYDGKKNISYEIFYNALNIVGEKERGTIEQINEQTNRLAQQIEELNGVYGRMIEALTVNMRGAQPAGNPANNN